MIKFKGALRCNIGSVIGVIQTHNSGMNGIIILVENHFPATGNHIEYLPKLPLVQRIQRQKVFWMHEFTLYNHRKVVLKKILPEKNICLIVFQDSDLRRAKIASKIMSIFSGSRYHAWPCTLLCERPQKTARIIYFLE